MGRPDRYTCEEVFRRLDDYLDRELTEPEMILVREHLETCAACAAEHQFQAGVIEELRGRLRRVELPADLAGKVWDLLDRAGAE